MRDARKAIGALPTPPKVYDQQEERLFRAVLDTTVRTLAVDNGPSFQQEGAGAVTRKMSDKAAEAVSVLDYILTSDGLDTAAAFRRACVYLDSVGGGKLHVPGGSYRFLTYDRTILSTDEYVCCAVPSNVEVWCAKGSATLILDASMTPALPAGTRINWLGTRSGTANQVIRGFVFDPNGYVSTVSPGFTSFNIVRSYGFNVLMEDLSVTNAPGRNMVVVGALSGSIVSTRNTVRRCTFLNGSRNVAGNVGAVDCSFVYMNGADNLVEDCTFSNASAPVTNCGGVEMHCSSSIVRRNTFTNLFPCMYVGVEGGVTSYDNKVIGNTFATSAGGISIIDKSQGLVIDDNNFTDCQTGGGDAQIFCQRDASTGISGSGTQIGTKIINNRFATTAKHFAMSLAGLQNFEIAGNKISGVANGIILRNSTTAMKLGNIHDNTFFDPVTDAFTAGQILLDGTVGAWVAEFTDIIISKNTITSPRGTAAPANIYPVVATSGATYTNCVFSDNTVVTLPQVIGGTASLVTYGSISAVVASGFRVREDGFYEQWGHVIHAGPAHTDQTFSFPTPFPTVMFALTATPVGTGDVVVNMNGFTTSTFTLRTNAAVGVDIYWWAVGK